MDTEKRLSLNRWLLLAARWCAGGFAAGVPGLTALWHDRGLSKGDFYLLEILFALSLLVLEVATGRMADRIGKVFTLKCGFVALGAGATAYWLATGFNGFLLGEVLAALGMALISGTDEAVLFQSNKALGEEQAHQKWWTWSIGTSFCAMAIFAILGARLSTENLSSPYILCACFQGIGLALVWLMVEPPMSAESSEEASGGTLHEAISVVLLSSSHVRWMALAPGFVAGINQTFLWMYPEYLAECDIDRATSGYVFALFNLVAGATALSIREIKDPNVAIRILFLLMLALGGSTFGLATAVGGLAWLLILPQQMVRSISGALFSHSINSAIPDEIRATALSIRNAVRVFLYVAAMIPWWLGVDQLGRSTMFSINLVMLVIGGGILWVTTPRMQHE